MADPKAEPGREGTRLISALEKCWTEIQKHHPAVPPVVFITGTGVPRRQVEKPATSTDAPARRHYVTRGHHWADRWVVADQEGRLAELFVAGETIRDGGEAILQTELHEAAHALAHVRGIRDTSPGDPRWHRKEFAQLAREVGLEPPRRSSRPLGFSNCTLPEKTRKKYASVIRRLDAAALPGLRGHDQDAAADDPANTPEPPPRSNNGKRYKVSCECDPPRGFPVTLKVLDEGPILCGICETEFTLPEENDQDPADEPTTTPEAEPAPAAAGTATTLPEPRPAEPEPTTAFPLDKGR
ncbi:hypothetical protein [Streptomyces jumonjinensis]|uniref:hypothetical protein n=1 Tax=Streptomyces jumonjinensis TaxID=1945 RepID=UPI00379BA33E